MIDVRKYAYSVAPASSPFGGFGARCLEIPDVACLGETPAAALEECVERARRMVETMKDPPEPFATRDYSGHISVRVLPSVHQALMSEAQQQGVSLNTLIVSKLARGAA